MRDLVLWLARELVEHKDAVKVDAIERDRSMKVMGKRCDAAEARKMIADECYLLNLFH